jgi:hypothetical protein
MLQSNKGIHNRQTRRAAANHFADLIKEGWGEWEDIPPHQWGRSPCPPPPGLKRFTKNNIYSVQFVEHCTGWGKLTRIMIRRHDQKTTVSWMHKQRIKNELFGEEFTALEVFPPESKLFDEANIYHLWIFPPDIEVPIVL